MTDHHSLYDEALTRFRKGAEGRYSGKELELLHEFLRERATPEETKEAAELLQSDAGKKYGGRKVGDVEIPESWIANIMGNIESFVAAGDFVTNNAPESVGMAWYAVRLTLTAIHRNYDLYTFFGSGLSDVSEIMVIIRHYDRLYDERSKPNWKPSALVEKLFQDVISAYAAVLDFSFAIKRHLTPGSLTRIKHGFKDFFGLSKVKFEDKLNTVTTLKKKILEESQGAFQDKTLTQLQGVSVVLAGIEDTVARIQGFQETQQKLHDDAMAKFDAMLKGLDEIKASNRHKSQWDYAVQDFKTYQSALDPLKGVFEVYGDAIDAIYPGTCQWVFEEPCYQQWSESGESGMLCITGPEGSGKSHVVATVANRMTQDAHSDKALVYVACSGSASGSGLNQSFTADSICRTFLSQLYKLAVQGEDNVGLLEACNAVFKKAKSKNNLLPPNMRGDSAALPEFVHGFSKIAALLKTSVVLVLDGLDRNALDDKNQEELLQKLQGLLATMSETTGTSVHILVGCASTKFFTDLELPPDTYVDVGLRNWQDMDLVLTEELKDIPGLSSAEQAEAKAAILAKARCRFLYVLQTAVPFMREPFQRPLSKRLEALPDDTGDVYTKILRKMSPNYLDLLRTALTWSLLGPGYPGLPFAREVMDSFQGTYDTAPETDEDQVDEDQADVELGFPVTSRLENDQLRTAIEPFLKLLQNSDGDYWIYEPDSEALDDFFLKSGADVHEEHEEEQSLCSRCGSTRALSKALSIDPKEGHLQMALTCLRHLNHPLFQKRAGLVSGDTEDPADGDDGENPEHEANHDTDEADPGSITFEATSQTKGDEPDADQQNAADTPANPIEQAVEEGYRTEDSIDDEDIIERGMFDMEAEEFFYGSDEEDSYEGPLRVRYELQYWPWHIREAEKLWPAEERATNSNWAALMKELDTFVSNTPVFHAWQDKYPDGADTAFFFVSNGPHRPLHLAAYLGLTSWTRHLLECGEEVNGLSDGYNALQAVACSSEDRLDIMKMLLEAGADVNAENGASRTALHLWLQRGDITVEAAETLLKHGADPRRSSSVEHFSALHYFAMRGEDPKVLDILLAHGADINAVHPEDWLKFPPLHCLLPRRNVPGPLLEAFIKHKADPNSENAGSARPLQMVSIHGQIESLKILLRFGVLELDDTDLHGTTAMHEAVAFGHADCVLELLEHGADPDVTDKLDRVALHTAARKGYADSVRALVQGSKNIHLFDKHGWSPFFCACLSKDEESASIILDALIERDFSLADINKPTRSSRTALRQAANHGFADVVSKLIRLASDRDDADSLAINVPDTKKGQTALHRAAMRGHAASVRALLAATPPADVTIRDASGRTALTLSYDQWAIATNTSSYEDILTQLIDADPRAATADPDLVAVCAANGSTTLLRHLWRLNADLNRPDRYGWTPLELARNFNRADAEAFLKRQAAWRNMLPTKWAATFPATTPVGAQSVKEGGSRIVHTSGKRVCVSAERPLPAGLEGYYFEVELKELPEGMEGDAGVEFPEVAVGFCTLGGAAIEFPGWFVSEEDQDAVRSWGYHSDTGGVYSSAVYMEGDVVYEEARYRVGDVVGAGVDLGRGEVWFTRNGVRLERTIKGVRGRLFPVLGLHQKVVLETNFGVGGEEAFRWRGEVVGKEEEEVKGGGEVTLVVRGRNVEEKDKAVVVTTREVVVDVEA